MHVAGIHRELTTAGATCRVLDTSRVRPGMGFVLTVLRHAFDGWTLHFHTNGHNLKSWLLALGCGLAGQLRGSSILTLHSGMVPGYLVRAPLWRRKLAAMTCSLYRQVICVSQEISNALVSLGVKSQRMEVLPAFLSTERPKSGGQNWPPQILEWIAQHRPLFSTVLFFRPEYGFDFLVAALDRMNRLYPSFGCLVMGSGEQRDEAEKRVRDAGLEESILLLGDVDHDACLGLISLCDVFLRPTLEDGDSISVREALSLGVPVVASRTGARPAAAILFRPGDLHEMLAKIEVALAVGRVGQGSADGLPGTCMDRLMEIYRQVDGSEGSLCLN